ncbi:MAG: Dabb family protein [Alistipes sp.]|nr:Dabb family protein [Alistipes sp.]MBR3826572.1 Dabb family protein [Alistipes sp.]
MIRHIVMWKFRRDLEETPEQIALEMKSRLEALVGRIDGLLRAEVGVNIKETASSYDAVLTADFPSFETMEAYKVHPLHVAVSDYCKSRRLERVDVDYKL